MSDEEKDAIEIVKEFNKENKFRDCGRLNNAIDIVIRMAEERNKYNITTRPVEKIKEDIEQNKNIFIFGKEYISKDKIKEKLNQIHNEFSNILLDKKLSLEEQNLNAHRYDAIRNVLEELLEEK
jgi:hypothetical protein